jgi:hypothetical protein
MRLQLPDSLEEELEPEGLGHAAIGPRCSHQVIGVIVTRREEEDRRRAPRATELQSHLDAVPPWKRDRQEDDVVPAGEAHPDGLIAIGRDVHRVTAVAQTFDDESSHLGMFNHEHVHARG